MNSECETVRGDDKAMPDKGTSTGVSDTYGAELGVDATNSHGKLGGTKSDPWAEVKPKDERI